MIFADSSSGLGTLGFSTSAFIIQLITFVLAFWVIKKFAVTPIVKMLNERRKAIEDGVSLGEKLRQEAQAMEEKVSKELSAARIKADEIIDEAKETARSAVKAGEEDAVKKADEIIEDARNKTKQEIEAAKIKLEGEIANLVVDATEVLTKEKIDIKKDASLINQAIKEAK